MDLLSGPPPLFLTMHQHEYLRLLASVGTVLQPGPSWLSPKPPAMEQSLEQFMFEASCARRALQEFECIGNSSSLEVFRLIQAKFCIDERSQCVASR